MNEIFALLVCYAA